MRDPVRHAIGSFSKPPPWGLRSVIEGRF
ncbi:hypothetical protein PLANTIT3_60138 [Plantibacter sp. T3]|nr:hypothetical protein PLANTIT3_60138 [Plantibacter sp. T3]